jgi:hypothetical protein
MATSATYFQATVPAGTAANAPVTVQLALGTNVVNKIRWRVPPGPRGHLGWALFMGGVQVVPDDAGAFIVADDEYDDWVLAGLPDSGAWSLVGYNTGTNDHTVYLGFFTTPVQLQATLLDVTSAGFPATDLDVATMWTT